jgi:hypothetical protein
MLEYFKNWIYRNNIQIDRNMEFMWFFYELMKIEFCTKFVQTYQTW